MDEAAHTISLISPSKSSSNFNTSNSDPTSFVLNERETRFASGMERDRSDLSRSIRHQEIFEPQPGNFGSMDCAHNQQFYGSPFTIDIPGITYTSVHMIRIVLASIQLPIVY